MNTINFTNLSYESSKRFLQTSSKTNDDAAQLKLTILFIYVNVRILISFQAYRTCL